MNSFLILLIIGLYFSLLMVISRLTSRRSTDHTYFDGNRDSPWFLVAFGMIGSGISAVSLVSIPGNVGNNNLYYFQFILGTIAGYLFIAVVLLPIFYKMKLISIYGYLDQRFGKISYKTGSLLFLVSQSFGAAFRLLLGVKILQAAFFDAYGIPYYVSIIVVLLLIWLYTNKSGIKTIVWTDALQSFFMITVIIISIITIKNSLGLSFGGMVSAVTQHPYAKVFNWDWRSGSHFFKQFISGFLITVALVGLDQSMMQKTLTVSNLKDAKKNMFSFSLFIAAAQTLFLGLGVLLYIFVTQKGIQLPVADGQYTDTDKLFPLLSQSYLGKAGMIAFFIGVVASTFATIDSCITALTTAFSYDFLDFEKQSHEKRIQIKKQVLVGVNIVMFAIIMAFWSSQGAIINTIFKIAGYTYGPILGLYLMGLFTKVSLREKWVPAICMTAPLVTWVLNDFLFNTYGFDFGFMNILVNAALTILFLFLLKKKK